MTRFIRHLTAIAATALLSIALLAGAVGPAVQPALAHPTALVA